MLLKSILVSFEMKYESYQNTLIVDIKAATDIRMFEYLPNSSRISNIRTWFLPPNIWYFIHLQVFDNFCLPKRRLSEAAHEIQGCSSQKCSRGGVG